MKTTLIITAFKEPLIEKAILSALNQNTFYKYNILVSAPDTETENIVKKYKKVEFFKDPGKGKSYALNLLLKKIKSDILILTDGDVFISNNAVQEILEKFEDEKVGAVSGRPVSINEKNNLLGFWSHFLLDVAAHKISRKKRYGTNLFLECSGYLFAFRNIIDKFPLDVAEDSIIPYMLYKQGYKIAYAENAFVYVKNPSHLSDFIKQRTRTAGAHSRLIDYYKEFPKVKSFKNELFEGIKNFKEVWAYPSNIKQYLYLSALFPIRLYIWIKMFYLKKSQLEYKDGWDKINSTK